MFYAVDFSWFFIIYNIVSSSAILFSKKALDACQVHQKISKSDKTDMAVDCQPHVKKPLHLHTLAANLSEQPDWPSEYMVLLRSFCLEMKHLRKTCTQPSTLCCITCPDHWQTRRKTWFLQMTFPQPSSTIPGMSQKTFKLLCIYAPSPAILTLHPWPTCTKSRCNQDCKAGGNRGPLPAMEKAMMGWNTVASSYKLYSKRNCLKHIET